MDERMSRGEDPLLITADEAARLLAISPRQLRQLSKDGIIKPIVLGCARRYTRQTVEAWIRAQQQC